VNDQLGRDLNKAGLAMGGLLVALVVLGIVLWLRWMVKRKPSRAWAVRWDEKLQEFIRKQA